MDNVAEARAAVDAVENDANEPNVVVAAVEGRDMLNAAMVVRQTVDRRFDLHQLKLKRFKNID